MREWLFSSNFEGGKLNNMVKVYQLCTQLNIHLNFGHNILFTKNHKWSQMNLKIGKFGLLRENKFVRSVVIGFFFSKFCHFLKFLTIRTFFLNSNFPWICTFLQFLNKIFSFSKKTFFFLKSCIFPQKTLIFHTKIISSS